MRIQWPDKYPSEAFTVGASWDARLGTATITGGTFAILEGNVTLANYRVDPADATNTLIDVSAGTPGIQRVLCAVALSDGTALAEIAEFRILVSST